MDFKKFKDKSYTFSLTIAESEIKVNHLAGTRDRKGGYSNG